MRNIHAILEQMSLSEKLAQMTQLWGEFPDGSPLMGLHYDFHSNRQLAESAGSILGFSGAQRTMEVQREYLACSDKKIPLMFMTDVIHGYRTIFPSPLALSCSWSPELVEETAAVAAKEASVSGLHVTFSPMADLVRDSRWGRVIESTGEDPFLNSLYTAAFVRGYQGYDISESDRLACCVKHFVGYGAAEGGRDYNTTQISEYQLRNFYLPPFQSAVNAGCKMVMAGFNSLNGIPCTANQWLFQDILRNEWHYNGLVITDCTAVYELVPHGYSIDNTEAARSSIKAGMDIEMVSTTFYDAKEELIRDGSISMELIDQAVERILNLKEELGLFDNPYKNADPELEKKYHLCKEHREAARRAVSQSVVLLKNEQESLPLKTSERIALIGPYSDNNRLLDIWKCEGKEEECITLLKGMRDGGIDVLVSPPCTICNLTCQAEVPDSLNCEYEAAIATAGSCDKIVLALGEPPEWSGESGSRAYITLPDIQLRLLDELHKLNKPIITVIFSGRPLELEQAAQKSQALLQVWFPGTEGGNGITDVLLAKNLPQGRLTMSFPRTVGQLPLYYNALPTGRPQQTPEGCERFRTGYIDTPNTPLYPFGYGLTYTTFQYSDITLSRHSLNMSDVIHASVTVINTGKYSGCETVQMYIRDIAGSYCRPVKMLKSFRKIDLQPQESALVTFTITSDDLAYEIPGKGLLTEPGEFHVFIGPDSSTQNMAAFILTVD